MSRGLEQTFLQRGYTNGQEAYDTMLNITDHPHETSPHAH